MITKLYNWLKNKMIIFNNKKGERGNTNWIVEIKELSYCSDEDNDSIIDSTYECNSKINQTICREKTIKEKEQKQLFNLLHNQNSEDVPKSIKLLDKYCEIFGYEGIYDPKISFLNVSYNVGDYMFVYGNEGKVWLCKI